MPNPEHAPQNKNMTSSTKLNATKSKDQTKYLNRLAMNIFAQENASRLSTLTRERLKRDKLEYFRVYNTILREEWDKLSQGRQLSYTSRAKTLKLRPPTGPLPGLYVP
jgi:hypothetical protein